MMDSDAGAGRGGKKNRMRQGRRKRSKNRGGGGGGGGGGNRHPGQQRYLPEPTRDESSILGARAMTQRTTGERRPAAVQPGGPPDAFALFCAYHLGITPDDGYQKPHVDEVARRYGLTVDGLRSLLAEHKIDEASIRSCRFDLEGAQLDIRVAPEGISRIEMARGLYEDLVDIRGSR